MIKTKTEKQWSDSRKLTEHDEDFGLHPADRVELQMFLREENNLHFYFML